MFIEPTYILSIVHMSILLLNDKNKKCVLKEQQPQ